MKSGRVIAVDMQLYSNAGYSLDLSAGVMHRSLMHCDNAYQFPNIRCAGYMCKTNLPTNTAYAPSSISFSLLPLSPFLVSVFSLFFCFPSV